MSRELVSRRHPDWAEHHMRWRWLADSLEGGERYRWAVYGTDSRGLPARNLLRHKREYPSPGQAPAASWVSLTSTPTGAATDDDYTLRLIRTPVPDMVSESIRKHLGRIYRHEVRRSGPDEYLAWAADVDRSGDQVDDWMRQTVAPQLLAVGCLDVLIDHPPAPDGVTVRSRSDRERAGLDAAVARVVPAWDVVWWSLNLDRTYNEVLVRESAEESGRLVDRYRYWDSEGWALYDSGGDKLASGPHPYGRVPMVRLFVARSHRCEHVGLSPLEGVAERQREYYNRDSELILSDVLQAHPLLQGPPPEEDGTISIGPQWLLAMRETRSASGVDYVGYSYVDPPKGAADSIRANLDRIRDEVDRSQGMSRPAGSTIGTVAQSGVSKAYDHATYNDLLCGLADALQLAEVKIGRLACIVATDGRSDGDGVVVTYSKRFDLRSGDELAATLAAFQDALQTAGRAPDTETRVLMLIVREDLLPGLTDVEYAEIEREIRAAVESGDPLAREGVMTRVTEGSNV